MFPMSYPYDALYPSNYDAGSIGHPSFDTITGESAAGQNPFMSNEVENALSYSGGHSSAPELQPIDDTWPVLEHGGAWTDMSGGMFFEEQSYNAFLENLVATGLPHASGHTSLLNPYDPLPGELAQRSEVHEPVGGVHAQDYSPLAFPQDTPSYACPTSWQPNDYTPSDAILSTSLAVPLISVDRSPSGCPTDYLPSGPQLSTAVARQRGAAASSGAPTPPHRQGLCGLQVPGPDSQTWEPSTSGSRLGLARTGASRTKRKERSGPYASRLPSPDRSSNPARHATPQALLSPYYRASVNGKPSPPRRTKDSQKRAQSSRSSSNASSPLSSVSASPLLSNAASPMSVTSVESDGSPQPSSCALPGGHSGSTQTRRAAQASAPLSDRTAVAKLLTQFFEQPSSVAHKPKYDKAKAELVCQWVNPIGMVCSNRKWANPGESLKKLTGRKTMGFCSGDRATVLRHLALHREEERLQTQGTNIPEDQRTIWDDFAIDGQLHLDSIRSSGEC